MFATLARATLGLVLAIGISSPATAQPMPGLPGGPGGPSGPTEVGVLTLKTEPVVISIELPGRAVASRIAEVRPQVGGVIKSVNFKAGQPVKAGDLLFEINPATYEANLAVAQASVAKAEAALSQAQAKVTRYKALAGSGVTEAELADAEVAVVQAEADLASAKATAQSAQINLDLTSIKAPIDGVIGQPAFTEGSLLTAAQATALATIRQLDPIYVDLVDTSSSLLAIRKQLEAGTLKGEVPSVTLTLDDGTVYAETGSLTPGETVISETTSTFTIRSSFANARTEILPGMFVRASVAIGTNPTGMLVPQRAVTFNAAGQATALFAVDGKAMTKTLTTDGAVGNFWLVTDGAADGDQLIVDGLQKINEGSEIKPLEVSLDENGVVLQTIAANAAVK